MGISTRAEGRSLRVFGAASGRRQGHVCEVLKRVQGKAEAPIHLPVVPRILDVDALTGR